MRDCRASAPSASPSLTETSCRMAFSASARYMAPLSMLAYPYRRASHAASVLFPEPAGPSMAITMRRAARALPAATGLPWPMSLSMNRPPRDRTPRLRRRSDSKKRLLPCGQPHEFARGQQRIDRLTYLGTRRQPGEKLLDLFLAHGHHCLHVLAHQRRDGFERGNVDPLFHRLWRPTVQHVPESALAFAPVHAGDFQDGPQLAECAVQSAFWDVL